MNETSIGKQGLGVMDILLIIETKIAADKYIFLLLWTLNTKRRSSFQNQMVDLLLQFFPSQNSKTFHYKISTQTFDSSVIF